MHCKDSIQNFRNKYSQKKWNCAASVPIPTFMFLWAIYMLPRSVYLFCCRKIGGSILGIYINRSQIHERGNWDWGRAVSFLGVNKSDFLCSVSLWLCNICIRGMTFRVSQYTENHSSRFKIPVDWVSAEWDSPWCWVQKWNVNAE